MEETTKVKELIKKLPKILEEHPDIADELFAVLSNKFVTNETLKAYIEKSDERFKTIMETINKRFEEMDRRFNEFLQRFDERTKLVDKKFEEIIETMNRRFEEVDKRFEEMDRRFNQLVLEMREGFARVDRTISALGARWGLMSERAYRNGIRELLHSKLGWKVEQWEVMDKEAVVYGKPSIVEVDLLIKDDVHTLIEIKASVSKSDVAETLRIGTLYEKISKIKPELLIITPFCDEKARIFAKENNVKIITAEELTTTENA
ncbi:MAG: DUF3782 domain-containing protein [Candidatus Wukongarchaeota archaeon]|nr:DUF3782 domain-containing protein [Candidatus Wukongarchaeota archaeon]MDO8127900.1 DUF3782 domain-containing protein [Candidatus Wukongarchaeota archaeon]